MPETTGKNNAAVSRYSRLYNTPIFDYACSDGDTELFNKAVYVFERESTEAFRLSFSNMGSIRRMETPRTFIIKLLLSLGILPHSNAFAVVARLIEQMVVNPDISMEKLIDDFAKAHATDKNAISRMIDKCFNIYNNALMAKVTAITQSAPNTAKDVVCDLAVLTKALYHDGMDRYE